MHIGFIGTGRIAGRLVGALAGNGHTIRVSRRNASVSANLAARFPEVEVDDDNQAIVDASDVVFLCLPPDSALDLIRDLHFAERHALVSVMAGVRFEALRQAVAPATRLAITIPMPFVEQGGCPLPVYPDGDVLAALLGERNAVIPVASEEQLAPFWAAAGSVLTVLAELRTISTWLGEQIDDAAAAERYVASLYGGTLHALDKDGAARLDAAIDDIAIEGGFNATFHDRIAGTGLHDDLRAGLDALLRRATGAPSDAED